MSRIKNSYFQFKKFKLSQENTAMKISTDACIFGALSAYYYENCKGNVLDIGCGTGLISFIWAQIHSDILIDGIDIDEGAYEDAFRNCQESPFLEKIKIHHTSFQEFSIDKKYDFILSNPPFFINSLKNENTSKSLARHADIGLTPEDLFFHALKCSHERTKFITLYPSSQLNTLIVCASKYHWNLHHIIYLKSFNDFTPHCSVLFWDKNSTSFTKDDFIIYADKNQYSDQMKTLLKEFYLHF